MSDLSVLSRFSEAAKGDKLAFWGWIWAEPPAEALSPLVVPAKLVLGLDFPRREGPVWFCTVLFISN